MLDRLGRLQALANSYVETEDSSADPIVLTLSYTRTGDYNTQMWQLTAGVRDAAFENYVNTNDSDLQSLQGMSTVTLPGGQNIDFGHLLASMNLVYNGIPIAGSWGGDCMQLAKAYYGQASDEAGYADVMRATFAKDDDGSVSVYGDQDLRADIGSINVGAIEEYKEVSERYTFLKEQIDDVERSKSELNKIIEDLTASMSEKFLTQFQKINTEFAACFTDFFGGGKGELILEEPDNCLESAIEIKIQPPGKSVQNINLFSGGEKSLAALALLFSVLKVTPSPFCIYDEVEAALDDVNVERFAKYMRRMTDKTQFISITHRRGTMEEADVLYGVTMQEKGVSKLLELQTAELAAKMGLEE